MLWIVVATATVHKAIIGELLYAPCIKDLELKEHKRKKSSREAV
jgi:hypothetical protein